MRYGSLAHVGIGKEASFGTAVAATDYLKFVSEGINEEIEQIIDESNAGIFDEAPSFEGLHSISGDLAFNVYPDIIGHILRGAFGAPVSTQPDAVGSPTVYEHVFTPVQANFSEVCALPPYSLEVHRDMQQAFQYAGAVINDLTFSFGTDNKIMQGTAAIIAKKLALIAKTVPSFEVNNPFVWNQAKITIGGAENKDISTLEVGISNSLEGKATIDGTKEISRIQRSGKRTFTTNLTFELKDLAEYNRFRAQTEVAATIELTGANISDNNNYKLKFEIPKLRYTAFPINVGGAGSLTAQVNGTPKHDSALGYAMKVTLTNTKASY